MKHIALKLGLHPSGRSLTATSDPDQLYTESVQNLSNSESLVTLIPGETPITSPALPLMPTSCTSTQEDIQGSSSGIEKVGIAPAIPRDPTLLPYIHQMNCDFTTLFDSLGDVRGQRTDPENGTQHNHNSYEISKLFENLL